MKAALFGLVLCIHILHLLYKYRNGDTIHDLEYMLAIILAMVVCSEDIIKEIKKLNK